MRTSLLDELEKRRTRGSVEFLRIESAVTIAIRGLEIDSHDFGVLVVIKRAIVVGVVVLQGSGIQSSGKLRGVERVAFIAIHGAKYLGSRGLRFFNINDAVLVRIETTYDIIGRAQVGKRPEQ